MLLIQIIILLGTNMNFLLINMLAIIFYYVLQSFLLFFMDDIGISLMIVLSIVGYVAATYVTKIISPS